MTTCPGEDDDMSKRIRFHGLKVVSIAYNDTSWEWIVVVKYTSGAPNTVTSMYLSKTGAPPYSKDVTDTFFVSSCIFKRKGRMQRAGKRFDLRCCVKCRGTTFLFSLTTPQCPTIYTLYVPSETAARTSHRLWRSHRC